MTNTTFIFYAPTLLAAELIVMSDFHVGTLCDLYSHFEHLLPLMVACVSTGLDVRRCSYFLMLLSIL